MYSFKTHLFIIFCFCAGILFYGCSTNENNFEYKKILFLGDSFTVGTGLGKGQDKDAFPYQLINKLRSNDILVEDPQIIAVDGDTTKHLLGALNATEPQSNPDNTFYHPKDYSLVVLSIGINDIFRGDSKEDYEHHFKELLNRSIRFAHDDLSHVIVLSIPAWDSSPSVYNDSGPKYRANKYAQVRNKMNEITIPLQDIKIENNGQVTLSIDAKELNEKIASAKLYNTKLGIAKEIDRFNQAALAVIEKTNKDHVGQGKIHFIDLTDLTRKDAIDAKTQSPMMSLFADDGIHYSSQMYQKWTEIVYPFAYQILHNSDKH